MSNNQQSLTMAVDEETGRPVIIIRDQEEKGRITGVQAIKQNIAAAKSVSFILSTSLGPKGADKIIVTPDSEIVISNDGATIMEQMDLEHPIAKLLVDLSKCQDSEIGDGTTGVVVLAGALLDQAESLLDRGIHPIRVADGYDLASQIAVDRVRELSMPMRANCAKDVTPEFKQFLVDAASTALGSKIAQGEKLANVAVDAVLSVADLNRNDADLSLLKVKGKVGGSIEDTSLVDGIVLDKDISHPQMKDVTPDAKLAILTCPFEPPKPKTKYELSISTVEQYRSLAETEQKFFTDMIQRVKDSGANTVICQWGFDDEANSLLMQNDLTAVRWVGGEDIEAVAIATGGRIVSRFEDLTPEKLGTAVEVRQEMYGTTGDHMITIQGKRGYKTVFVRGSNKMVIEEAKRSLHDAMCVVRDLIRAPTLVPGGACAEIAASLRITSVANETDDIEQYALRSFAAALDAIPMALARNSGLQPIEAVAQVKAKQLKELERDPKYKTTLGVDCMARGTNDMAEQRVFETLASKTQQLTLATQVTRMVLKIDDIIGQL
ncbi:hypothetical protein J8273_5236 [Carpediemonas membranifera]|uniref:T-complex protein 1 subunit epsilon n=1 Tax=Carpediemonas membranifera TaxID=201153 RepID=A0A8J6AR85_9EUKA|nr:hypothetical protein J8273_5236 [Carpediemonas membranifera]|eukprot:KAG9392251.1 hypothetical protein J8273_5236 [Carpediemonas membranifera]